MRLGFVILAALHASVISGQVGAPSAPASLVFSKEVGRLDSMDSHAVVTALIALDASAGEPTRMKRVQIDFLWADRRAVISIAESLLPAEKKIFDGLMRDIGFLSLRGRTGPAFIGSCEFRDHPDVYPLQADYSYAGPGSLALRIFGPQREQILFPGLMPGQLSKILGDAMEVLKAH